MSGRSAAGGGRWVEVAPARLARWVDGFALRHGSPEQSTRDGVITLIAPDGARAELHRPPGLPAPPDPAAPADLGALLGAVVVPRRIGLVLARQASVAVGIAYGDELETSKVDSSYVQGRTAAGGWSQQRFARRRENQAKAAAGAAADIVVRVLLPELAQLATVVTGGDRRAVGAILADPRLAQVAARRSERFLDVGEPRLVTLRAAAARAATISIKVSEPD